MPKLDDVVTEAATMLCGMQPDDQAAALAAGCEAVAETLHERQPDLTDDEIRGVCEQLAHKVNQRLAQFNALGPDPEAFN